MPRQIFEELFGSKARVKILKFFLRNGTGYFNTSIIAKRVQERTPLVKHEIKKLLRIGFVQKKNKAI